MGRHGGSGLEIGRQGNCGHGIRGGDRVGGEGVERLLNMVVVMWVMVVVMVMRQRRL
jgi:hypothetical protein